MKNHLIKFIIPLILFPIIIISISIFFIINNNELPSINNLSYYTNNYESDDAAISSIINGLYSSLLLNTDKKPSTIQDINIRENSITQTKDGDIFTTSFIIDIDSLKQSYEISFTWDHNNGLRVNSNAYNGIFYCVKDKDKIIYPNSPCNDLNTVHYGTNDPDAKKLPYVVPNKFRIIYHTQSNKIIVNIPQCLASYTDKYEAEAKVWLEENNISMDKVIFRYCSE